MTDKADNSPPAFPSSVPEGFYLAESGMTLRDYFAGQALAGFLASEEYTGTPKQYAVDSYTASDAMLKERTK